jgi:acetyl-CoA synthetase
VIIAFVVLNHEVTIEPDILKHELSDKIRQDIGAIATPKQIYFVSKLPKTRSGKIMRRLLKSIANNEKIGDISTLEDDSVVTDIQNSFDAIQKSIEDTS